ncbi:MAG: helix-turn-helix transcriptional regulator [Acidobacteria bacterium]|nr:helix-turn-helix transcriptional regulator [Acidobacteriota bacterium]
MADPLVREFLLGFWKIHILHHAAEERGVYGQWMLEELRHHGYKLSPGTLYPVLARMEKRGWLRAEPAARPSDPRVYRITPTGARVLDSLRSSLDELQREVSVHGSSGRQARTPLARKKRTTETRHFSRR